MKRLILPVILSFLVCFGYCQSEQTEFIFPSKESKFDLLANNGLIQKKQSTTFRIRSNIAINLYDVTIVALNGSISHDGEELILNVGTESLIYLLFLTTDEVKSELKYLDLIGVPIAEYPYPYISVYADNVPVNPERGIQGNTNTLELVLLYDDLKGSCQQVLVNKIAVSFTDRLKVVGSVRREGNTAFIKSLLNKGTSPHIQIEVKAEAIACVDDKGVLRIIYPKIKRSFSYGITSSNLDKDIAQLISHMNAENKKQANVKEN